MFWHQTFRLVLDWRGSERSILRRKVASGSLLGAVKRRWSTAGTDPPGNWFAPPGSNRSSSGGNEAAEASGVEGRVGDLASLQAVMQVNAEQAPKQAMQELTCQ